MLCIIFCILTLYKIYFDCIILFLLSFINAPKVLEPPLTTYGSDMLDILEKVTKTKQVKMLRKKKN